MSIILCMMQRKNIETQMFQTTIKEYTRTSEKNLTNLILHADVLKITDKVRLCMGYVMIKVVYDARF